MGPCGLCRSVRPICTWVLSNTSALMYCIMCSGSCRVICSKDTQAPITIVRCGSLQTTNVMKPRYGDKPSVVVDYRFSPLRASYSQEQSIPTA